MGCPLCSMDLSKEIIFYEDGYFLVLRTKKLKGHRERFMIISKEHIHTLHSQLHYEVAIEILVKVGTTLFKGRGKFIIMDSTFATINEHWHLVCSDLDPKADDFDQILATKWLGVYDA